MAGEKQNESVKTYRPWVGVVLSLFISGSAQFLAKKRLQGIAWFVALPLLATAGGWCLASPLVPGDLLGFILLAAFIVLWIAMLIKSYRPVARLHWVRWIGFASLFLLFCEASDYDLVRPFKMPTSSMSPTIQGETKKADGTKICGDRVMVEEYAYWFSKPQRGDIIVFKTDGISSMLPQNEFYAKRIAGLPGDVLSVQDGHLFNHGQPVTEPSALAKLAILNPSVGDQSYLANVTNIFIVSKGCYFVIGDNTTNSFDSRFWGTVPEKNIIGRVSKIYWPLNRAGKIQ